MKEPNISIYFCFPPITQWLSISFRCSVFWWKGIVRY